jgi:hypothetical protein
VQSPRSSARRDATATAESGGLLFRDYDEQVVLVEEGLGDEVTVIAPKISDDDILGRDLGCRHRLPCYVAERPALAAGDE